MNKIPIIFQDDYLVVLDKPAGLIVSPAETVDEETVSGILEKEMGIALNRGGVVHRLDKDTSGLLIAAKTQEMLDTLQMQFKERLVKKEYLALVHGFLAGEGTITGSIGRNPRNREKFTVLEGGRESETGYKSEQLLVMSSQTINEIFAGFTKIQFKKLDSKSYFNYTLVRLFPLTGRTHQIRVHLKYKGFSIVGDAKYGGRKTSRLDHRWCPRQFLHATKISFYHPMTGQKIEFESKLPDDLEKALSFLKVTEV